MNTATKLEWGTAPRCFKCRDTAVVPSGEFSRHGEAFNDWCECQDEPTAKDWPEEETYKDVEISMLDLIRGRL